MQVSLLISIPLLFARDGLSINQAKPLRKDRALLPFPCCLISIALFLLALALSMVAIKGKGCTHGWTEATLGDLRAYPGEILR